MMIEGLMNFYRKQYRIDCAVMDVDGRLIVGVNERFDEFTEENIGDVEGDMEIMSNTCNYKEITDDMEYEDLLHIFDAFDYFCNWEFFEIPATLINL